MSIRFNKQIREIARSSSIACTKVDVDDFLIALEDLDNLEAEVIRLTAKLEKYRKVEEDGNVLIPTPNPWGPEDEIYDQTRGEG